MENKKKQEKRNNMAKYKIFSKTEEALYHDRKSNEDNYMFFELSLMNDEKIVFVIVADGMGGLADGQQTSANAVEGFSKAIYEKLLFYYMKREFSQQSLSTNSGILVDLVRAAFVYANEFVCSNAQGREVGTTLSVIGILNNYAIVANVGDSPVYYYNSENKTLDLISQLHTEAELKVKEGKCVRYSPEYHAISNIVYKSLGQWEELLDEDVYIDILGHLNPGDMFLIGSDGAFGRLTEDQIMEVISGEKEYQILDDLFKKARCTTEDDQTAIFYKMI